MVNVGNIQTTTLTVDSIEIDPTGASLNQVLKFNGTKFIPASDATGVQSISYEETIGDGTNSLFVVNHNLGTKDINVIVRESVNPYDVVDVRWEATTANSITIDFEFVPNLNSKRVAVKGPGTKEFYSTVIGDGSNSTIVVNHGLGSRNIVPVIRSVDSPFDVVEVSAQATSLNSITLDFSTAPDTASLLASVFLLDLDNSYIETVGDGTNNEFTITHNLNTRDIGLICRTIASPYDFVSIRWEATTANTAKVIFSSPPTANSRKIGVYTGLGGSKFFNDEIALSMLDDVSLTSLSNGQFLSWDGTNWVNSSAPGGAGISTINDLNDVTITSAANSQFLKYNGSAWVNEAIDLSTDTTGDYVSSLVAGTGINISNNSGEGATPTISLSASLDNVSDVVITSPEEFQTLQYDGSAWTNKYAPVVSYVRNAEANTITTGTCVYLFGSTGDHATVKRADNSSDTTSSKTIGVVGANIASSENGPVVTRGYVDGINLSVGYAAGDVLWLGENGAFTKTKPTAPDHLVFIGVVVRATNNGIIYVATQNGYELDELHDVSIIDKSPGNFLKYNGSLWVNDNIDLGTDTVGDYVSSLVAGTGITLSNNSGEGSTPTVEASAPMSLMQSSNNASYPLTISSANETGGGTGYSDILKLVNSKSGATNPNKHIRINSTGGLEIVNSAYNDTIFYLADNGNLSELGTVNGATLEDTGWISVSSFANSFSAVAAVAYRKINNVVYLRGNVTGGTAGTGAFTLPVGYRPSLSTVIPVQQYGTGSINYVTVGTDGVVVPNASSAWLSSIIFPIG